MKSSQKLFSASKQLNKNSNCECEVKDVMDTSVDVY